SATVTGPVKLGTTLLAASSALTCTAGLIAAPATVVDGCTVNTSWVAVPGVMSNALLVTGAKPEAAARSEERRVGKGMRSSRSVATSYNASSEMGRLSM